MGANMGLHKGFDESQDFSDLNLDDEMENLEPIKDDEQRAKIRKIIEDRLEQKRLKEELGDEFDGEFDWDDFDK